MTTIHEVISRYAARRAKKTTQIVEWSNGQGNVYCRGRILYSYGSHWPLAVYVGRINDVPTFIKNGDRYSISTAGHLSATQHFCKGPTVSRAALDAAGINFAQIILKPDKNRTMPEELADCNLKESWSDSLTYILFWREDSRTELIYDREEQTYFKEFERRYRDTTNEDYSKRDYTVADYRINPNSKWKPPSQGMFIKNHKQHHERYVEGHWHILGAVVLENHSIRREYINDRQTQYYLCSLDEGSYFVSKLPRKPESVQDAFECLKPEAVVRAEQEGKDIKRQGEWFFIPYKTDRELASELGITIKALNEQAQTEALPLISDNSNRHVTKLLRVGEKTYAKGRVFHRFPSLRRSQQTEDGKPAPNWGTVTGQHRTVHLDGWHEVHKNTELESWSGGGRVD